MYNCNNFQGERDRMYVALAIDTKWSSVGCGTEHNNT